MSLISSAAKVVGGLAKGGKAAGAAGGTAKGAGAATQAAEGGMKAQMANKGRTFLSGAQFGHITSGNDGGQDQSQGGQPQTDPLAGQTVTH